MKIFFSNFLRINPGPRQQGSFSSLSAGQRVEAGLVRKTGAREAVIDIAGTRVHARFTGAVPDSPRLNLILEGFRNGSYIFNLDSSGDLQRSIDLLKQIFLAEEINLHRLNAVLNSNMGDIFSLNLFFSGIDARDRMARHHLLINLMNGIIGMGMSRDDLFRISLLFLSNMPEYFSFFYREIMKRRDSPGKKEFRDTINKLIKNVDKLDNKEKFDCLKELFNIDWKNNNLIMLPVYDGEVFSSLKLIQYGGYLFVSVDLSALGRIDIILKRRGDYLDAAIVLDDAEKKDFFSGRVKALAEDLAQGDLKIRFNLFDRKFVEAHLIRLKNELMAGASFNTRI